MALSENYFKSRDVRVFPSSFRGNYNNTITFDPEARLNTEANFIVPKISGNKASYIVNYNTNKIKFVLGGYYFEINNITDYDLSDKYVNIKLRDVTIAENQNDNNKDSERKTFLLDTWETTNEHSLDSLDSEASVSYFSGLKISTISPESTAYASIKLFDAEGNINQEAILVDIDHGKGENTLMHGVGLTADTINQTVFGTYNDNKTDTLFEIGKGSGETNKNNALEISTTTTTINNATNINGNTIITGSTKIDGTTEITDNTEIKGELSISKDTESDSATDGALKVTGGVGVGKNLNVGGDTNLNDKLIVKTSPADTETNVKVDGTLNVTGKTDIYSNVTIDSDKTTLAKPVEITDASDNALTVKGKTTVKKDLEVGDDTKVLIVKNSPSTGEQNVTITGTLKATDKATFENGLEVASGKTANLGGQLNVTGAVNINTSNQENPGDVTIYGDTFIHSDLKIAEGKSTTLGGTTTIEGATHITDDTDYSVITTDDETTTTAALKIDGGVNIAKKLNVNSSTTLKDSLTVADEKATILGGSLEVKSTTTLKDTLNVADGKTTTLGGGLEVKGTTTLKDNLTVVDEKTTTLGGNLEVKGTTTLNKDLTVKSGKTTLTGSLEVNDSVSLKNNLTVADEKSTTLGGTLEVKGATTLNEGLTVADGKLTTLGGDLKVKGTISISDYSIMTSNSVNFIWTGTVKLEAGENELELSTLGGSNFPTNYKIISVQATVNSSTIPPDKEVYNMFVFAANWIHHDFYFPITVYAAVDNDPKKVKIYANRACSIYLTAYCTY